MTKRITFWAKRVHAALVTLTTVGTVLANAQDVIVEDVEIRGNRRIPRESILYYVQSKPNDRFDLPLLLRILQAIIKWDCLTRSAPALYRRRAARREDHRFQVKSIRSFATCSIVG
ncbi:MAG: hypothetical protein U0X75_30450 [Acidobacteriota bacterium]